MCKVATVVMVTLELVLNQFKTFYHINLELNEVSVYQK